MFPDDLRAWLALSNVPGVGPGRFRALLSKFGSPEETLRASFKALCAVPGVDEKTASAIKVHPDEAWLDNQIKVMQKAGADVISYESPSYPERLREIYDPPPMLFVKGTLQAEDARSVAIVGSRMATPYGRAIAEEVAGELAGRGICVVSGMARGIDSAAHRGALSKGGRTLAVLGCGVDVLYPPENHRLREAIIEGGVLLSEFPMRTEPESTNFPKRNRLISGLSLGVVVVEADERSGALLTAQHAVDQNREVFAVPGNITVPQSRGPNRLIKGGAKLVQTVDDILEELEGQLGGLTGRSPAKAIPADLSDEEGTVLQMLSSEPKHIDTISAETGVPVQQALSILLSLELAGLVRQLPGKMFVT